MKISRRDFVKGAVATAASVLLTSFPVPVKSHTKGKRYAMAIDVDKCYGCMACVAACAAENNVPISEFRTWVEKHVVDGKIVFVPKLCNHCDEPSCVEVCPVGATYRNEDGIVLVDDKICIGCGFCIQNCPYGARFMNPVKGVADKCTYCAHRIYKGRLPACVEACPTDARIFGDLKDPESEVSKYVRSHKVQVLKPWTGNEPNTYYVNLPDQANR